VALSADARHSVCETANASCRAVMVEILRLDHSPSLIFLVTLEALFPSHYCHYYYNVRSRDGTEGKERKKTIGKREIKSPQCK
jgi:hypothetical protein